jgi:lycopene cyclase domain-containing protein
VGAGEIFPRSAARTIVSTHFTYLLVDLGCLLVPLLFSFHASIRFDREWKYVALPALLTSVFFLVWDALFTAQGVWGFNPDYVLGIYVYNLPLEEILFFLCIPYACVFTYFCIRKLAPALRTKNFGAGALVLAAALVLTGLFSYTRLYTLSTFVLCGAGIIAAWFLIREHLALFFVSYLLVIPFFLLSNGILTGSFLEAPVVWYNNEENLGVRIFTIPAEDVFYGMLLILMNVMGYERMRA